MPGDASGGGRDSQAALRSGGEAVFRRLAADDIARAAEGPRGWRRSRRPSLSPRRRARAGRPTRRRRPGPRKPPSARRGFPWRRRSHARRGHRPAAGEEKRGAPCPHARRARHARHPDGQRDCGGRRRTPASVRPRTRRRRSALPGSPGAALPRRSPRGSRPAFSGDRQRGRRRKRGSRASKDHRLNPDYSWTPSRDTNT